MIIYREWLRDDPYHAPNVKGSREVLTSVMLETRGNRFYIQSFNYQTIEPADAFSDFEATISNAGRVSLRGGISSYFADANHVVPTMKRLSANVQLPDLVPFRKSFETGANQFDTNLRFYVKLTRLK